MSGPEQSELHIFLLGHPRVERADGSQVRITSKKGIALLAMLAMSERGERSRAWLQQRLWGSRDLGQAQSSLRRELANLRRTLDGAGTPCLECEQRTVRLRLDRVWVDIRDPYYARGSSADFLEGLDIAGEEDFEDWLREMRNSREELLPALQSASSLPGQRPGTKSAHELRPAIAVAPLTNGAGTDGSMLGWQIRQMLIDLLSRRRWLPIVAADLTGEDDAGVQQRSFAGRDARYLLQTEVLQAGPRCAIGCTLVERPDNLLLWTDSVEISATPSPAELSRVLARIASWLGSLYDQCELARTDPDADIAGGDPARLAWRICVHLGRYLLEDVAQAEYLLQALSERHPAYGELPLLQLHLCVVRHALGASEDRLQALRPVAQKCMAAAPLDARGPLLMGFIERAGGALERAAICFGKSHQLDATSPHAAAHLGSVRCRQGRLEQALYHLTNAYHLAPLDPVRFFIINELALVHFLKDEITEALDLLQDVRDGRPDYLMASALEVACHWERGACARAAELYEDLATHDPQHLRNTLDKPLRYATWSERIYSALSAADIYRLSGNGRGEDTDQTRWNNAPSAWGLRVR